ncbi:undecaprenyl-diphosphatase UppP [Patescibacteria group bacterium]|nr:undecaprenyl-diphosphatase UppP [Patescibacteria group bacterium]
MEIWQALVLGIVQGITEFLPVSSSGHLVLVRDVLAVNQTNMLAFDVFIHLGTLAAVVLYFWRDLLVLAQTLFRKLGRLPVNEKDFTLLSALAIGTVPAAIGGFFFESFIEEVLMSPVSVAVGLCIIASLFMYAEWRQFVSPQPRPLTLRTGLLIGLFQLCALIPGVSRSGTTIAGGMLLGLSRYDASRFSFLLAIPITAGAGAKMAIELISSKGEVSWAVMVVGAVTAFVLALIVIHFFLSFIRRYTLWPFVWYSLAIALLVLYRQFLV